MSQMGGKKGHESGDVSKQLTVKNKLGIHARPAAMFVKVANKYRADIIVEKDGQEINGKSIMGLMMLAAGQGSVLKVTATGEDCAKAVKEIELLIERKFDEE